MSPRSGRDAVRIRRRRHGQRIRQQGRTSSQCAGDTAIPDSFAYTLTAQQRDTLQGALEDAYHSRDDGADDSYPIDAELREKYARLAEFFGLTPDW